MGRGPAGEKPGSLSFRDPRWSDIDQWRKTARGRLNELLLGPGAIRADDVQTHARYAHDGLHIEELSWQLPYGPRTRACFLKPAGATGRLPGILALHDHGGDKHFGHRKIVRTRDIHPMIEKHQRDYYGGVGWANEMARRGFAVLAHDVFPFESRRVLSSDLPPLVVERLVSPPMSIRELTPEDLAAPGAGRSLDVPPDEPQDRIDAYNAFGGQHESVIAKSLFCAGLSWPGVMVAEDRAALDYLASRSDVDPGGWGAAGCRAAASARASLPVWTTGSGAPCARG